MSTGIPSTLIVKTDSTDSLSVSMSAPTPPYISSVFSNTVIKTDANGNLLVAASGGGSAPDDATYITQTPNATLTNEQALSLLSSGIMRVATTTGVVTALTDSAGIAANISDETGSGFLVFGTLPAITFPNTGVVIRDVGNDHTLTIAPGTDLSANRILTLTTGDAARTITLTGNPTLDNWFDQSVKVAGTPTFNSLTLSTSLTVPNGGTGVATQQAYGVLVGGTTATGAMQSITPGTSGFVLTSAGVGALPTWAAGGTAVEDQNNILANQVFS